MEICDADGREDDIALGAVKLSLQDVGSLGTKATKNDLAGETKLGERGIEGKKHPGQRGHLMYAYGVCDEIDSTKPSRRCATFYYVPFCCDVTTFRKGTLPANASF